MKGSLQNLGGIAQTIGPFLLILGGGLGTFYCATMGFESSIYMFLSLIALLSGIGLLSYQETQKGDSKNKRTGTQENKAKSHHKRHGKRCPQCNTLIYYRRTVCQHCGYEFSSHQDSPQSELKPTDKDNSQ